MHSGMNASAGVGAIQTTPSISAARAQPREKVDRREEEVARHSMLDKSPQSGACPSEIDKFLEEYDAQIRARIEAAQSSRSVIVLLLSAGDSASSWIVCSSSARAFARRLRIAEAEIPNTSASSPALSPSQ